MLAAITVILAVAVIATVAGSIWEKGISSTTWEDIEFYSTDEEKESTK